MSDAYVLRGAFVLDPSGSFSGPLDVAVVGGRIGEVGRDLTAGDAPSFDFEGIFLLPGIFDCHAHVAISSLDQLELLNTPVTRWALEAGANARRILEGGVTFVRDAGGADAGIRAAVDQGIVQGPRLQISVVMLAQTGGHTDGFLPGPGLEVVSGYVIPDYPGRPPFLVDGPEQMRAVVREVLRAGADWVKLCTTGGVMSAGRPEVAELTLEEIGVAVFEAGRQGKAVMAHAMGGEGLDNAVAAGVRSIEHGLFLTEEQARRMAARGCWLVPTLAVIADVLAWAEEGAIPPDAAAKAVEVAGLAGQAVAIAERHGVPIAVGTDSFHRSQHGRNLRELALLGEAGMTPEKVLLAATLGGAQLCGVADTYGRIAQGFVFDAVCLDVDPTKLSIFAEPGAVTGVFKGGVPVVPHARLSAEVAEVT